MTIYSELLKLYCIDQTLLTHPFKMVTQDCTLILGPVPRHYLLKAAELLFLTKACKLAQGKYAVIYLHSQYAFVTVHVFA